MDALQLFSRPVREWFSAHIGEPTHTQRLGWPVLAEGKNALVVAPTGTGKTLCAFLNAIDSLLTLARKGELDEGVRVLYISPLKALGNDIERNLDSPLQGIERLAPEAAQIKKMVRTGDTAASDRRRMAAHPPHILITTPESLYLMLTSKYCEHMFEKVKTVIVDEVHALLDSKRGTHLALSLERLSRIADYQRVGLSATVEPMREAALFLAGDRPIQIVDARAQKNIEVLVESPTEDYRVLPENTIWPQIAKRIYSYAGANRQTLVFCNNRMVAENLARDINKLADCQDFAATHHGSVDKDIRLDAELRFKGGMLRCLCATSSMELGIDVGSVDLVIQVASPRSAARGLQRLGRAGHKPGDLSRMRMFPRTAQEVLECAFVGQSMLEGVVESMKAPRLCLDVLAQHIVSMTCREPLTVDELLALARGAYPYRDLEREDLIGVLRMLRGDFEHAAGRDARPRIAWDEGTDTIESGSYGRLLAMRGGTIPDRGLYPVVTAEGTRVGELDEEFVYEARLGDRFNLGAFAWAIVRIQHDRVVVAPAAGHARAPFWTGDGIGRPSETGERYGREMALLEGQKKLRPFIASRYPLDGGNVDALARVIGEQMDSIGCLPTDRRVVVEHYRDEMGECFAAFHCLLGGRVNNVLSFAIRDALASATGRDVQTYHSDDGIMAHAVGAEQLPTGILRAIDPDGVRDLLLRELPSTALFAVQFRQAAAIALMLGGGPAGKRNPLWVQRLRGAEALSRAAETYDHPLIIETYRQCIERLFEVDRAIQLLRDIRSGEVQVVEVRSEQPSQFTREFKSMAEGWYTYYDTKPGETGLSGALASLGKIAPPREALGREPIAARDEDGFFAELVRRGALLPVDYAELAPLAQGLIERGRARLVGGLLVASHEAPLLADALEGDGQALRGFLLRFLRAAGEADRREIAARFGEAAAAEVESALRDGEIVRYMREGRERYAIAQQVARAMAARARQRRAQIHTFDACAYAALLPAWQGGSLPAARLGDAIEPLAGFFAEAELWEEVILPARVDGYRARDLDQLLLGGELVWRCMDGRVAFYPPEQEFLPPPEDESPVYAALRAGGAQFIRQLARRSGVAGAQLERELARLAAQGLAVCDGFSPMRKRQAEGIKRAARARSIAMAGEGRWEAAGQAAPLGAQDQLNRLFDRWAIVSKECADREGIPWPPLMDELRRMEFAQEVRRGYFVRGLSGAQFVRSDQLDRVVRMLQNPEEFRVLCAVDPAQAYGNLLAGAGFMCLPGTVVVLERGVPVLAAERRGECLRALGDRPLDARAVAALAEAFKARRIWPSRTRITVKEYPQDAQEMLRDAGFLPEMLDFTLWRG